MWGCSIALLPGTVGAHGKSLVWRQRGAAFPGLCHQETIKNRRGSAGENVTPCLPFLLIEIGMAKWKSRDFFSESCLGHLHHALESWLAERREASIYLCGAHGQLWGVRKAGFTFTASLSPTSYIHSLLITLGLAGGHPLPRRPVAHCRAEKFPCVL